MFITQKHLSRRTVLRGLGVTLSLPLLDSMLPAQTPLRKTAASRPPRLACIEMVHGAAGSTDEGASRNYWSPAKDGANFDFSYSLEPLAPFRDRDRDFSPLSTRITARIQCSGIVKRLDASLTRAAKR